MILAGLLAVAALAQSAGGDSYRDGDGTAWQAQFNRHGAVLRSRGATLYLGRSCEAYSPQFGRGRWEWANGGFLVIVGRRRIGFPRQEIDADTSGRCRS